MNFQENISLKDFGTFRIGGPARFFCVVKNQDDLREAFFFAKTRKLPIFILGGGSNLLFSDNGYAGLVVKNEIKGIKITDEDDQTAIIEAGAGETWDDIVALSLTRKLFGLENLSGIPGTVGGAAVQNAGAYGSELADCLLSVCGLNMQNGKKFKFDQPQCQYSYRNSFFKKNKKYVITTVRLSLKKKFEPNLKYAGLKAFLNNEKDITAEKIRTAVLKIRAEKLPDWRKVGTAGSYFKNPVISIENFSLLKEKFPLIPSFVEQNNEIKVPLAWILDNICHLKGYCEGNVGLYEKQPIVLVNYGGATAQDVQKISLKIKKRVEEETGIKIEEEVESL